MKRLFTVLIITILTNLVFAQTHGFVDHSKVFFYPLTNEVKKKMSGYDCFYETDKVYVKGELKLKPKNRLCPNSVNLTPFEEVERAFVVLETKKVIVKKNTYYVANLIRDDEKRVTMVLPFGWREEDNALTQGMINKNYDKNWNATWSVNIPFIEVDVLMDANKYYSNRDIVRYAQNDKLGWERVNVVGTMPYSNNHIWKTDIKRDMFEERFKWMNYGNIESLFIPGCKLHTEGVVWRTSPNCVWQQPVVSITVDGKHYGIPLEDIYGYANNGKGTEFHGCKISDFYMDYEEALKLKDNDYVEFIAEKGDNVYYRYIQKYEPDIKGHNYSSLSSYELKRGKYKYIGRGLYRTRFDRDLKYSALIVSSANDTIVLPFLDFYANFITQKKVNEIEAREEEARIVKEEQDAKDFATIERLYGKKYSSYFLGLSDEDKEKFKTAAAKWGAQDAKDIVEGYVKVGWTKEKCIMSWGRPRDINKTTGSWGTHEQWCYYSSS